MDMQTLTGAKNSKTVWLGLALTIFGFLQTQANVLGGFMDPKWVGVANVVFGVAVIVLRFVTTESLAEKGSAPTGPK